MTIERFYKEWSLETGIGRPRKSGWRKVKVYREPTGKYRTIKTGPGSFAKVPTRRNVYCLAWNGALFAEDKELAALKEKHPDMLPCIIKLLKQGTPQPPPPPPLAWVKEKLPELFSEKGHGNLVCDFGEWALFLELTGEEWSNYVLVRKTKAKKGEGRNIFHLAHNGERFARQTGVAKIHALYPELLAKVARCLEKPE